MLLRTSLLVLAAASAMFACSANAAESYDNCTGFVDSLPATIATQGTWCLRKDLTVSLASGAAITIAANNVILDCNGFGVFTSAADGLNTGVASVDRVNVAVRRCHVEGFNQGIRLGSGTGGNYRVEENTVHRARAVGIHVDGDGSLVRANTVADAWKQASRGIWTRKTVDILENVVDGMFGEVNQWGIHSEHNLGGRIQRNRVRRLFPGEFAEAVSIVVANSPGASVRDNDLSSYEVSSPTTGVRCVDGQARLRGNIIKDFATGMSGCADVGGNDVTPP